MKKLKQRLIEVLIVLGIFAIGFVQGCGTVKAVGGLGKAIFQDLQNVAEAVEAKIIKDAKSK